MQLRLAVNKLRSIHGIFIGIVIVFVVLMIIGMLKGDPDIETLDMGGLERQVWLINNWINNYVNTGCPERYREKFQYKKNRLERVEAQLVLLKSKSERALFAELSNAVPDEVAKSKQFQQVVVADTLRQMTDLLLAQNLLTEEDAWVYIKLFSERVFNHRLSGRDESFEKVSNAVEEEMNLINGLAAKYVQQGVAELKALSIALEEWKRTSL